VARAHPKPESPRQDLTSMRFPVRTLKRPIGVSALRLELPVPDIEQNPDASYTWRWM